MVQQQFKMNQIVFSWRHNQVTQHHCHRMLSRLTIKAILKGITDIGGLKYNSPNAILVFGKALTSMVKSIFPLFLMLFPSKKNSRKKIDGCMWLDLA